MRIFIIIIYYYYYYYLLYREATSGIHRLVRSLFCVFTPFLLLISCNLLPPPPPLLLKRTAVIRIIKGGNIQEEKRRWWNGISVGLRFSSKKTSEISIVFEDLSRIYFELK